MGETGFDWAEIIADPFVQGKEEKGEKDIEYETMNLGTLTCTNTRCRCGEVGTLWSATRYFQRGGKWGRGLLSWTKSKAGLA